MKLITINPNNEPYYSEDFIKGFECGTQRQFEADKASMPTWIPCSERMPEEKERVESYIRDKRASEFIVMIKGANKPTTLYLSWDNYWFDENHDFYEVCAWQTLPKPWEGADDEQ